MDDRTLIEPLDQTIFEEVGANIRGPVQGWLTIWNGTLRGRDFSLFQGRNFIGSDPHCDIRIIDIYFPPFAVNIRIGPDHWQAIDLDSDDGFVRNDRSDFRCELTDGDWIQTGNVRFRVKKR